MARVELGEILRRELIVISSHPGVRKVGPPVRGKANGTITVDVTFEVNLPNEWRQAGESPSGVRREETVRFDFPDGFPLCSPELSLRIDFDCNLPHMQPWLTGGRPVPCVYDGDLAELLHKEGLAGILNHTAAWLDRAALGTLIDPEQGWEPVRRDSFRDIVVADAEKLQGLVDRDGGLRFLSLNYLKISTTDGFDFTQGQVSSDIVRINSKTIPTLFNEIKIPTDKGVPSRQGKSVALVIWPGKLSLGRPIICGTYLPETVGNVSDLRNRAEFYSCLRELDTGLDRLRNCLSGCQSAGSYAMAIIFLVRRPFKLIGTQSSVELCPYVVDIRPPSLFIDGGKTKVRPAAHRHVISRPLLSQMAGNAATTERPHWTLVGAGSLGSKLALHLARAGNGPAFIVDKSIMAPHNAARHALVPAIGDMQFLWTISKASLLSEAVRGLNQNTTPVIQDLVSVLAPGNKAQQKWLKPSWAIVNATASPVVRTGLAASRLVGARVIETSLFAGGVVGAITVEGPGRNPNTEDLMAEFYTLLSEDSELASLVFDDNDSVARQNIGHGCGSLTMTMSDGRLSLFAAGMAEYLLAKQRDGLSDEAGEILIGRLSKDGLSLTWRTSRIPSTIIVEVENMKSWRVHIHERAAVKMRKEASCWPDVETGGVLMGRLSETARVAHVVDVLEAPEDSRRSSTEFILGTKGLGSRLAQYTGTVNCSLYCLGTWHTHLSSSGPSVTDLKMARAVSVARLIPSIFLILNPTGFHAFSEGMENDSGRNVRCPVS